MTEKSEHEILSSLGRLHQRLDETNRAIAALQGEQQRQTGICQGCQEKLARCYNDLHGNGREGVISVQARHAQALESIERRVVEQGVPAKMVRNSKRTSIGAAIIALCGVISSLISWLMGG